MAVDLASSLFRQGPSQTIAFELESASTARLMETLAAFANSTGGTLFVGVDPKNKTVRGVKGLDAAIEKALEAGLRCEPPLILPRPQSLQIDNKDILAVQVPAGLPHAYGLRGRYLTRSAKSNVPLGPRQLRQLLRERGDTVFEMLPASGAGLDDLDPTAIQEYATLFLGEDAAKKKQAGLDLLSRRGCLVKEENRWRPTISGYLLFAREPQSLFASAETLLVRYPGRQMSDEFVHETARGPLAEQLRRAERFVTGNLRNGTRIDGLQRTNRTEYPLPAVREAIVNAIAHRDYAVRGDEVRVLMFSDRIEVYSPGRLPGHVTLENLVEERFSRNEVIAQVLADMGFVERLGYGIDRMIRLMQEWELEPPRFEETANGFRVTLRGPGDKWAGELTDRTRWQGLTLNERQRGALDFLSHATQIASRDYHDLYPDVSEETLRRDLADLVEQGVLLKMGNKRGTYYILKI